MRFLLALALVLMASVASAAATPSCYSGLWYEPATSGNGFSVTVTPNIEAVAWFTFKDGEPVWFTAQGLPDTLMPLFATAGSGPNQPGNGTVQVGVLSFSPTSLTAANISFQFFWPSDYCSGFSPPDPFCGGTKNVVPLLLPNACHA